MRSRIHFYPLLAGLCVLHALAGEEMPSKPAELAMVKSWDELFAQPALDAGSGRTVRLGIEARCAAPGAPVMVYALVEGPADPEYRPLAIMDARPFGYFSVQIAPPDERRPKRAMKTNDILARIDEHEGTRLFALPVRAPKKNHTTVRVLDSNGRTLAAAELAVSDAPVHPWLPLSMDSGRAFAIDDLEKNIQVALVPKNLGLEPKWPEHWAFLVKDSKGVLRVDSGARLPSLNPADLWDAAARLPEPGEAVRAEIEKALQELGSDEYALRQAAASRLKRLGVAAMRPMQKLEKETADPDLKAQLSGLLAVLGPGFRIEKKDTHLHVTLPVGLSVNMPHHNFLVRLWINGKPFAPEPSEGRGINEMVSSMRTLRDFDFVLQIDDKKFGINSGDKVELQMLCAPDEIESRMGEAEVLRCEKAPQIPWPILSNRIEWKAK